MTGHPEQEIGLGAAALRERAHELGVRPTKQWGQNFVVDANTVRRIVRMAELRPDDVVAEVGPGLGSLTLGLLAQVGRVVAVEVDPRLAAGLPETVRRFAPDLADRLTVVHADALTLREIPGPPPTALVANLPYNIAVPVVLTWLDRFPSLERVLVMVQLEVAQRLSAPPGSRAYGVPSVKAAWYGETRLVGTVSRSVFWPVPNVDSGLVLLTRRPAPTVDGVAVGREALFAVVDAAFSQRRKTLRAALAAFFGGPDQAERVLRAAGVDPGLRGERLDVQDYARIALARDAAHRVGQ